MNYKFYEPLKDKTLSKEDLKLHEETLAKGFPKNYAWQYPKEQAKQETKIDEDHLVLTLNNYDLWLWVFNTEGKFIREIYWGIIDDDVTEDKIEQHLKDEVDYLIEEGEATKRILNNEGIKVR